MGFILWFQDDRSHRKGSACLGPPSSVPSEQRLASGARLLGLTHRPDPLSLTNAWRTAGLPCATLSLSVHRAPCPVGPCGEGLRGTCLLQLSSVWCRLTGGHAAAGVQRSLSWQDWLYPLSSNCTRSSSPWPTPALLHTGVCLDTCDDGPGALRLSETRQSQVTKPFVPCDLSPQEVLKQGTLEELVSE